MRGLLLSAFGLLLSGCPAHRMTLSAVPQGRAVDVGAHGGAAGVAAWRSGAGTPELDPRALALGRYGDVERALNAAPSTSRDDVAVMLLKATSEAELARVAEDEAGRRVLMRMYDEMTSGSVWDDEREQAQRVLGRWAERIGPERFVRAIEDERTRVFPVRKSGPTVMNPISPVVRLSPNGLDVSFSSKVALYSEWSTLQKMYLRVADDEVVGVKLYDAGGVVRFVPALFLLEVSNAEQKRALQKCGEMFALGLSLGAGALSGTGGRAASALRWCDRTAVTLGALLSVLDDHRGWILRYLGDSGARFLRYADGLASLVAFYGLGRVAVAVPRALDGLRRAYQQMKASKAVLRAEDTALLNRIGHGVDDLADQAERVGKSGQVIPIESARKPSPMPVVEKEPLRATGTDARLVPVASKRAVSQQPAFQAWGDPKTLADHFKRHGPDFGSRTAAEYVEQASAFLIRARRQGLPMKVDSEGVIRIYDPTTNTFGSYNSTGTTRTFYKPDPTQHGYPTNLDYWNAQPGRLQ